jgi:hypothetical protein
MRRRRRSRRDPTTADERITPPAPSSGPAQKNKWHWKKIGTGKKWHWFFDHLHVTAKKHKHHTGQPPKMAKMVPYCSLTMTDVGHYTTKKCTTLST